MTGTAPAPVVESFTLLAPLSGLLVPLEEVPDPVFAQRLAGDGISLDPTSTRLLAPCDGRVLQVHRAAHAVTLDVAGLELVIHVGLDTVELKGEGFTPRVRPGDAVRAGDLLLEFDADLVARRARSLLTQVVVANVDRVARLVPRRGLVVAGRDAVMEIVLAQPVTVAPSTAAADAAVTSAPIVVRVETGLHARPAATLAAAARAFGADLRLVKDGREANLRSLVSVMALDVARGDTVTIVGRGADAREAVEHLARALAALEDAHAPAAAPLAPPATTSTTTPAPSAEGVLRGVAASAGAAIGRVFLLQQEDLVLEERAADADKERRALDAAIAAARRQLEALRDRMTRAADADRAAIFAAHQELLEDPDLLDRATSAI
ncbi:MAG TPA: glucose PTS transporter subunit IIA, partial [Gemmatimonadaceae bacterium]|nr:glucose PTS transporter subunit IIA [Gemmatimonadaceae bacterium]